MLVSPTGAEIVGSTHQCSPDSEVIAMQAGFLEPVSPYQDSVSGTYVYSVAWRVRCATWGRSVRA